MRLSLLGTAIAMAFVVALSLPHQAFAKQQKVKCNPKGVEFEVIGCLHNANVDLEGQLMKYYETYLDSLFEKCRKDNPGGGSGGFADRTTCAEKALKAEADRINYKKP